VSDPARSPEKAPSIAAAHPLATLLIERLGGGPARRVLDFASGSGRNARALADAGFSVVALDDRVAASLDPLAGIQSPFAAALSTHGLLHGAPEAIGRRLSQLAHVLVKNGLLYATFGSVRDARFERGERVDDYTYAPASGDERGVAHAYFDRARLTRLLEPHFAIESLEERSVDSVAGAWAHRKRPLAGAVHWFAIATAR
jgi:SAM-dependent methyltransferase